MRRLEIGLFGFASVMFLTFGVAAVTLSQWFWAGFHLAFGAAIAVWVRVLVVWGRRP